MTATKPAKENTLHKENALEKQVERKDSSSRPLSKKIPRNPAQDTITPIIFEWFKTNSLKDQTRY